MNKKIRFSLLTLLVMLCGTVFATKTVYFKANSNWLTDGARFALYMFGSGEAWTDFTVVDADNNIYKATFDDNQTSMIIARMNPSTTENNWNNKWNQTGDLAAPTADNQLYTLADGQWDDATVNNGLTITENYSEPVAVGYTCDFNTAIAVPSNNHSDPMFQVSTAWTRIADRKAGDNYYGTAGYYMRYTYSSNAGAGGTGTLLANAQQAPQSTYDGTIETVYDYIVTPKVSGTVTLQVKGSTSASNSLPSFINFYAVDDDATTVGNEIVATYSADLNTNDFVTATLTLNEATRIAIRGQWVYMDNFTATSAEIPEIKALTVTNVMNSDGQSGYTGTNPSFEQQPDGTMLVKLQVAIQNTGNVDIVANTTENYTLTLASASSGSAAKTYYEDTPIAITEDLSVGESTTVNVEVAVNYTDTYGAFRYWFARENLTGTTSSNYRYATSVAYEPKFVFRTAESTATSSISDAEAWGTITEGTTKSFEIANTGTAPLTIKSVTLPDGFTSDNAPAAEFTLAKGETQALNITQDASATGTYTGTLTIVYLDKNAAEQTYNLAFSATVIGANTWTADFNGDGTKSSITYPEGAIAEGGISSDYVYNSTTKKYDVWLTGRTTSSYASGNNMFITPKLHANAGDKLAYDVKGVYNSDNAYYAKVYVSTDRVNWGEPVAYYTYNAKDGAEAISNSVWYTRFVEFAEAGDYYVAFALYGTMKIDNLVGLEKCDVAHDLYIKSVNWPDASIKSGASQSKPSVDIIPLTNEAAENYTVKYVYGENVVNIDTKALTASASSTTSFAASFTPAVGETTTFPGTKVVFEFTDGTKFETETFDLTVTNEPIFHFQSSKYTSRWYEPSSDYTTPYNFGKINTAESKTFWILNWGSAPLTVKSISVPEGFTASVENMNLPAFDGTQDGLETCQQSFDVTFTATEAGTYNGNLVITYVNGAGEDATFELAISGTKLDPNKWYANFGGESNQWPAGSVYQSNVSTTYVNTGDYAITSSSTTNNIFVTPKLTAAAGDKLLFDAKLFNSSWSEGKVVVYAAATREEVLNAEEGTTRKQLFSISGKDETNPMTTDYQTFEVPAQEGDYYYGFEISNRPYVDEIYGLTPVAVAHDWMIASSNIPVDATKNTASTATINIRNLGIADEAADSYTVTAYIDGTAAATGKAVAIPMNHKLDDAGTQLSVSYLSTKAGTSKIYLEVKAGDYSVKTDEVEVTFAEEVFVSDAKQVGTQSSTGRDYGFVDWYNADGSTTRYTDILYKAAKISAAGIKAGDKISAISFKGTNSAKTFKAKVTSWVATSNGDVTLGTVDKASMTEVSVYDATGAAIEFPVNFESVITLPTAIVWDGTSDIRIYTETVGQGSGNYISVQYPYDSEISMSYNGTTKYGPVAFFSLEAEAPTLAGTVKNSDSEAIEGATVTLKAANGVEYSGTTDAEGAYNFDVIQAGLDYTVTVEAENYLTKKEFNYNLGGESQTKDVTLFQSYGIVGGIGNVDGLGFGWGTDKVMTQSTENPNVFTLVVPDVEVAENGTTFEYKVRADGKWKQEGGDQFPEGDNNNYVFNVADTYTLTFTFTTNVAEPTLTLAAESNTLKEATELAEDDDAVAVGKLRKAIEDPENVTALKAAVAQFKADNADMEKDETAKAGTSQDSWTGATGFYTNKKITTATGEEVGLAEGFGANACKAGFVMQQEVTVPNGTYKVELYATSHNAWSGKYGGTATLEEDATDVAHVFATGDETATQPITSRKDGGMADNEPTLFAFNDVKVSNGKLSFGLAVDKSDMCEWQTVQIKSITWFTTAKAAYAAVKANMTAEIAAAKALKNAYRTEGVEAIDAAIAAAEATLTSNMLNVTEFEAEVTALKAAMNAFRTANYVAINGTFYVQNVASGKFMAAGHNYGTRGIVDNVGLDITFKANENKTVDFDTQVFNGDNNHFLGSNLYMDSSSWGWIIEQVGENAYTIGYGTQFIGVDKDDNLILQDAATEWALITQDARIATLDAATAETGVDATFLIKGANFNRGDKRVDTWTVSKDCTNKNLKGGAQTNMCAESWHSTFTIMQTIEGAPAGIYKMTAQGFYRQDDDVVENAPQFFANGINMDVPVKTGSENGMSDASGSFTNGLYTIEPIEFAVKDDGKMYVGIYTNATHQWVIFDNFRLTYYGPAPEITISEDDNFDPEDGFANVTLERTFSSENWNTFVVPFDIDNATLTEKFGNDVQVAEYSDEGINADNVTVHFDKMTSPAITANVPVLLKTTATAPITFSGVQVKAAAEAKKEGTYFDFVGSYKDQEFVTTGNYYLYENKIYKSTSDNGTFIKGTRAYLKAKEDAGEARIVNFTIGDEIVTGINVIDANNGAKENIYNLNGQKVDNVKKGLYIKNGKKVMMK